MKYTGVMKNILVPTDFSDNAKKALDMAVNISKRVGCTIHLINFVHHPIYKDFAVTGDVTQKVDTDEIAITMELLKYNKSRLASLASDLAEENIYIHTEIVDDTSAHGIDNYIKDNDIDLTIMGSSHQNSLIERISGTKAEQVTDESKCPVLTVHKNMSVDKFKNIVVWVKPNQKYKRQQSLEKLRSFIAAFDAKVHLAVVSHKDSHDLAMEIKEFANNFGLEDYSINVIKNSSDEEGLLKFAHEINAGLIVSFKEGSPGIFRLFTHNVSDELIRHADIPVVTFNLEEIEG